VEGREAVGFGGGRVWRRWGMCRVNEAELWQGVVGAGWRICGYVSGEETLLVRCCDIEGVGWRKLRSL